MKEPVNFHGKYYYGKYDKTANGRYTVGNYVSGKRRDWNLKRLGKRLHKLYVKANKVDRRRKRNWLY